MNRLKGNRCYLCGAMDRAKDRGVGWREYIKSQLSDLGIVWADPCRKPTKIADESAESHQRLAEAKGRGDFDYVRDSIKLIRCVDLRLTDITDFMIVNIDTTVYAFGTIEEISNANRQKKPIIVHVEQGKANAPAGCSG